MRCAESLDWKIEMTTIKIAYHEQTRLGRPDAPPSERGNCDKTCLATLIGIEPMWIPNYQEAEGDEWWRWRARFLNAHGFHVVTFGGLDGVPDGLCIAAGKSPRGNYQHAVLAVVGAGKYTLIHDPHPSHQFLDGEPVQFDFVFQLINYMGART